MYSIQLAYQRLTQKHVLFDASGAAEFRQPLAKN